jgi:hypothetical protein
MLASSGAAALVSTKALADGLAGVLAPAAWATVRTPG